MSSENATGKNPHASPENAKDIQNKANTARSESAASGRDQSNERDNHGGSYSGDVGSNKENETDPDDHALADAAEAIIFSADQPVPAHRIAEIFAEVTGRPQPSIEEVEAVVQRVNDAYASSGRAMEIHEWGGGYRMATRTVLSPFVKALFVGESETSLSRSLMETLGVLAYRQPVTRPEVDFIRGVNSDYAIRKLLELGLADVKGRADSLGRPLLYGTTQRFLEQFGLNSLEDLPTLREVKDLLDDPAFDEERAKLLQLDAEEAIKEHQNGKEGERGDEKAADNDPADEAGSEAAKVADAESENAEEE